MGDSVKLRQQRGEERGGAEPQHRIRAPVRPRSAGVTEWPHGETVTPQQQPGQWLSSSCLTLSKDARVFLGVLCPFQADHAAQFWSSFPCSCSHPPLVPNSQVLVAFLSLPTMPHPSSTPSRHTQQVQRLLTSDLHPLLEYRFPVKQHTSPWGDAPLPQTRLEDLRSRRALREGKVLCAQGGKECQQGRTMLLSP